MTADPDLHVDFGDCLSCPEAMPEGECPKSLRPCGHHCNHSWDQDRCHWCGVEFGEDGIEIWPEPVLVPYVPARRSRGGVMAEYEPEPCRLCGLRPAHYGYWCAPCLNPDPKAQPYIPASVDPEEG